MTAVAAQLTAELADMWACWQPWLPAPIVESVLATIPDLADQAAEYLTDTDIAAQTAYDILDVIFGDTDLPAQWWTTPLGHAVARALPDKTIGISDAARILGVSRQRAHILARNGQLASPVTGYVTLSSVLTRLETRKPAAPH